MVLVCYHVSLEVEDDLSSSRCVAGVYFQVVQKFSERIFSCCRCLVSLHAVHMSVFSASPFLNQDNNKCMSVYMCMLQTIPDQFRVRTVSASISYLRYGHKKYSMHTNTIQASTKTFAEILMVIC